jgi:hypothetical protein
VAPSDASGIGGWRPHIEHHARIATLPPPDHNDFGISAEDFKTSAPCPIGVAARHTPHAKAAGTGIAATANRSPYDDGISGKITVQNRLPMVPR